VSITQRPRMKGYWAVGGAAVAVLLVGCSGSREPRPVGQPAATSTTSASTPSPSGAVPSPPSTSPPAPSTSPGPAPSATTTTTATTTVAGGEITGTAVAGAAGAVEAGGPPFGETNPFSEAVRLSDGSCIGWAGSQGGSTAGLAVGARVLILDAERNEEIGRGTIERSRWEDVSAGGRQWNCFFDFTATLTTPPPVEFRIRVATLEPWLARPDPAAPDTFVASVNTDAAIGLIPSCPPVPEEEEEASTAATTSTSTTSTTRPRRFVSGWRAVGQYWSRGVASLCRAGLPVTAIARPCRPEGVGSEYIAAVVDSNDSTVTYPDGARVPVGTEMTVVVATGRLCE
jgi:hypothetical protein